MFLPSLHLYKVAIASKWRSGIIYLFILSHVSGICAKLEDAAGVKVKVKSKSEARSPFRNSYPQSLQITPAGISRDSPGIFRSPC